jgi:protein involved in polysaccharide export with SLBB domain
MPSQAARSMLRLLPILAVLLIAPVLAFAQSKGVSGIPGASSADNPLTNQTDTRSLLTDPSKSLPPVDHPIDPNSYLLGPNDQLIVSLPILERDFPVIVSMDNTLVLPRGFMVNVQGMTLTRLRQVVDSLYRSRSASYKDVGVSLARARSIYISIEGDVLHPGRMVVTAADRVMSAIDLANRTQELLPDVELEMQRQRQRQEAEQPITKNLGTVVSTELPYRHVSVRHNDGTISEVDLLRYQAFGDTSQNPMLREGDIVYARRPDATSATIVVAGAVNRPAAIPYSEGDNALMLVRLAAGFRDDANPAGAYVARHSETGLSTVPVDATDTAKLASIPLSPGDQLVIPTAEARSTARAGVVSVVGEVMRPSAYPIVPGVTKLTQVIEEAGGFTSDASLNGAFISRPLDPKLFMTQNEGADAIGGMATSSLKLEDTIRFKYDSELQKNKVSVDFPGLFEKHDPTKDIVLQHGDQIVVPTNPRGVFVRGRVALPGWVAYKPGAQVEDYIKATGGYTEAADKDRVAIVKFGTGIWKERESDIRPGDEIYVPGERDTPARTSLEQANTFIQITSALVGMAVTIAVFIRDLNR